MVSRPEDSGKALSPLMILIMGGFFGVTALGAAGDNLILKIGSYIPLFRPSLCHLEPLMAMQGE